jgi:hypothetical protein
MRESTPADVRELMLYLLPGEGTVSSAELERRRDEMHSRNPELAQEFRSASLSVDRWQREYRSTSRASRTTMAEIRGRLSVLEELLRLEPGELTGEPAR